MRKFEYVSKDFKKADTKKYNLALQFSKYEYGFSVYNKDIKKFILVKFDVIPDSFKNKTDKLSYIFDHEPLLKLNFSETAFIYCSTKATLVPSEIYVEETKASFFNYNYYLANDEIILSNKIENSEIINLFSFPEAAKSILASHLTNYKIYHQYTSFIESSLLAASKEKDVKEVFINVNDDFFNICVTYNKKLIFNNSFHFQSIDDFIYFIQLVLKNLKLNYKNIPIILSGNISAKVGTYKILTQYFTNIKFKANFPNAAFSKDLKIDKHYFDNLIYITV